MTVDAFLSSPCASSAWKWFEVIERSREVTHFGAPAAPESLVPCIAPSNAASSNVASLAVLQQVSRRFSSRFDFHCRRFSRFRSSLVQAFSSVFGLANAFNTDVTLRFLPGGFLLQGVFQYAAGRIQVAPQAGDFLRCLASLDRVPR